MWIKYLINLFPMTLFRKSLATIVFGLLPFIVIGQDATVKTQSGNTDEIITAISLSEQLNEIADEFHSQFEQNPLGLDPSQNKRMMDLFRKAFDKKTLLNNVRETFQKKYNASYADSVVKWINSDSSQKVLHTKKDYFTLQGIRKRVVNKYELEQTPPSQTRKNLIDSLAKKTLAAKSKINANVVMFRSVVKAFSQLSDQRSFSDAQIENFVNNYRMQMSTQMDEEIANELLVMYHNLNNNVLRNYISFYNSEPGQWLTKTTKESIQSAFDSAANHFLESVDKIKSVK